MGTSLLTSPTELKIVNVNPDTLYVNFKFVDEQGVLSGASLPEHCALQLDEWQKAARKDHEPVPTSLTFAYQVDGVSVNQSLLMRSHGSSMWSWLLFSEDIQIKMAHGTVNKGLFAQVRFSSHLLHTINTASALVEAEHTLYSFIGQQFHLQMSEVHLCVDIQGFDFASIRLVGEQLPFVSRVTSIRDRPIPPIEEEQEGGLSPADILTVEEKIAQEMAQATNEHFHDASLLTAHRRIATIDFGSHASDISAQIYNKTLEMKKHRKDYFHPIHLANGWDGESDIWRIEFRFRRPFLRDYELNEVFSVLPCLHLLWKYATEHWLRFVDLDEVTGVNISRRPTHPIWELVQHAYDHMQEAESPALSPAGEQEARLTHLIQTKPLQTLEYAVSLLTVNEQEQTDDLQREKQEQTDLMNVLQLVRDTYQDASPDLLQEAVRRELGNLSPAHLKIIIDRLSPPLFEDVRGSLVRQSRHMAKMNACIAGALGYLRSAVALMPPDELPGFLGRNVPASRTLPDLLLSLIWFLGKARDYDHDKHRIHLVEVQKKRLAYGFITAQEIEEQQRLYGLDLSHEDWASVDAALALLSKNNPDDHSLNDEIA
jgi:hypothetical protein